MEELTYELWKRFPMTLYSGIECQNLRSESFTFSNGFHEPCLGWSGLPQAVLDMFFNEDRKKLGMTRINTNF